MKFYILSFVCICFTSTLLAQWNLNPSLNTPVCTAMQKQVDTRVKEDGMGGVFIAWKDYRALNGLPDIYAQHIDSKGFPLWAADGVVVCEDAADQSTPAIETDMRGGVIIAWSDWRSGIERDIYAQRINAAGNAVWATNGVPVTTKPLREHNEKIVSDGKGGAIIVWEQQQGTWDVWAQCIDSNGVAVWQSGGKALSTVSSNKLNPKIQKDRSGGAIVCWQDNRNGLDYDIYAQRIKADGTMLWGSSAKIVCNATNDQFNAKIESDSINNGCVIAWVDNRTAIDYNIYSQKIDSNGNAKWLANGVIVCNAIGNQSAVDIVSNNVTNDIIYVWKDERGGDNDIYAQKLNTNGNAQWGANGVVVCSLISDQVNPNICTNMQGGAIVAWQDFSTGQWDVRSQDISTNGIMLWASNGVVVSNAVDEQSSVKNVSDGNGGSIYAWQDKRTTINDIYAHHLFNNGSPNIVQSSTLNFPVHIYPNPCTKELYVTYTSANSTAVYAKIIDVLGNEIYTQTMCSSNTTANEQKMQIHVEQLPAGNYYLLISTDTKRQLFKISKN